MLIVKNLINRIQIKLMTHSRFLSYNILDSSVSRKDPNASPLTENNNRLTNNNRLEAAD